MNELDAIFSPETIAVAGVSTTKGKEVILGLSKDPVFGHAVMFGLGGIFVEIYKDVAFRLSPMGRNVTRRMVKSIKGYPIFRGVRGDYFFISVY